MLESERLYYRPLEWSDREDLSLILQDEETMTFYEGAFSDEEVEQWISRMRKRQGQGLSMQAVLLKTTGAFIGQCGLTMQQTPDGAILEVGYLFNRDYWHQGYATEAARFWMNYANEVLKAPVLHAIIRETNEPSSAVAKRLGMKPMSRFIKEYRGVLMPHVIYGITLP